jgi:uncharacterized protein (DUF952 family)
VPKQHFRPLESRGAESGFHLLKANVFKFQAIVCPLRALIRNLSAKYRLRSRSCRPCDSDGEGMTMIYHIVKEKEYLNRLTGDSYSPVNFDEHGFVHCALEASVVIVANEYYSNTEDRLLVLKIDPLKLKSQTKYEPAAPEKGAGLQHTDTSLIFPHVYGPIDNFAIEGVGVLQKVAGKYLWPMEFISMADYLRGNTTDA